MKFDKGLARIASITTKTGSRILDGTLYSKGGVFRVDEKTAIAAEEDGEFIVVWDDGYKPDPNAEEETALPMAAPESTPAAVIIPKHGIEILNGTTYTKHGTYRVDEKTALAAEITERFRVMWAPGRNPNNKDKEALPPPTPKNKAPPMDKTTDPQPTETPEAEEDEAVYTPEELKRLLGEYDDLKVSECNAWLEKDVNKQLAMYLAENAHWKGSRTAAKEYLEEL